MKRVKLICISVMMTVSFILSAAEEKSGLSLIVFRTGQVTYFQTGGDFFTGSLGWIPSYHLSDALSMRLLIEGAYVKTRLEEKSGIGVLDLLTSIKVMDHLYTEIGGGGRYFMNNGGLRWSVSLQGIYRLDAPILYLLHHFYLGYSAIFVPTNLTHEIKFGVGIGF